MQTANIKYHWGPCYGACPSGCVMDPASSTWDTARGGVRVNWVDLFSKEHSVDFSENPGSGSCTVSFPIPHGGTWSWQDGNARQGNGGLFSSG